MSLIFNGRTKLLATALNTAATSCFTVGIATRLAGYIYTFGNRQGTLDFRVLCFGAFGWLAAAILLHILAPRILGRLTG